MLRELINWCSGKELYAAVTEVSNVWLSTGIDSHEKQLLLSIVNLSPDIRKSMKLVVAQQFAGADAEILTLSTDGQTALHTLTKSSTAKISLQASIL